MKKNKIGVLMEKRISVYIGMFIIVVVTLIGCTSKKNKEIELTGEQLESGSSFQVSTTFGDVAEWKIIDVQIENAKETWNERKKWYIDGPIEWADVADNLESQELQWLFLTIEAKDIGKTEWTKESREEGTEGYYSCNPVWLVDVTKWRDSHQDMLDTYSVQWCDQNYTIHGKTYYGYQMEADTGKKQFTIGFLVNKEINLNNLRLSTSTGNVNGLMVAL